MAVVVDSSVLVAALHPEDSQHARGVAELERAGGPIGIPEYIAVETIGVLFARGHKQSATIFLRALAGNPTLSFIPSVPSLFGATARYFLSTKKRLSFVDCALVALSAKYDVLTFDKLLARVIAAERKNVS